MFWEMRKSAEGGSEIVVREIGEFDLFDTFECGQCFRYERLSKE